MIVYINGRFLSRKISGVERFSVEIIMALDGMPEFWDGIDFRILLPGDCFDKINLKNIKKINTYFPAGNLWEQMVLPLFSMGNCLLSLANSAPILLSKNLVVIHDAAIYRFPLNYSRAYVFLHKFYDFIFARRSKIITVSNFSRQEIGFFTGKNVDKIDVVYNGVNHINKIKKSNFDENNFKLIKSKYVLMVGSVSKNKNIDFVVNLWKKNKLEDKLVVVGSRNSKIFNQVDSINCNNVIYTGRISDEDLLCFYENASYMIFPSLYEGFGIPPLEAAAVGCKVVISDIPPMREIFGDSGIYFDPSSEKSLLDAIESIKKLSHGANINLKAAFSWENSAKKIIKICKNSFIK